MTISQTITTPREMIEAIAAGPTGLFNQLIVIASDFPTPARTSRLLPVFEAYNLSLSQAVCDQLQGGYFKETSVPRPSPARPTPVNDTSAQPMRRPAEASVLFFEATRHGKGQRFEAVIREGAEGVILPAQFYWQPRSDQQSDLLRGPYVVSKIAMLKASGKSSFTSAFGQLRQR